jgi:hypothetical protein
MDPITLSIAAITAGAGIAQSIFGATQAAAARKKQQALVDRQVADINKDLAKQYVDTPEAQAAINTAKENADAQARRNESRAALTGASHEAKLAAAGTANKAYTDTVRAIAAGATRYKNNLKARKDAVMNNQAGIYNNQAESGNNMMTSGLNTTSSGVQTLAAGFQEKPEKPEKPETGQTT